MFEKVLGWWFTGVITSGLAIACVALPVALVMGVLDLLGLTSDHLVILTVVVIAPLGVTYATNQMRNHFEA